MDRYVVSLTTWLSQPIGFLATCFCVVAGLTAGILLSFDDHWALVFNLLLSIGALLLAALILVATAKDTATIQAKLDELVRAVDKADDRLIGIDRKSAWRSKRSETRPLAHNQPATRPRDMDAIDALGFAAGGLTAASQFPQAIKAWRTRSVSDLSLRTLGLLGAGLGLWIAYGVFRGEVAICLTNGLSLALTLAVIGADLAP